MDDLGAVADEPFVRPRYEGPSLATLLESLYGIVGMAGCSHVPSWLRDLVGSPERVVLLVLDGFGYLQLRQYERMVPTLSSLRALAASSCAPTTTATALTSLTTGTVPAQHGVLGYRIAIGATSILNVLRWSVQGPQPAPPVERVAPVTPFLGANPVVVTKATYGDTAFTRVHLRGARFAWWSTMSQLVTRVLDALGRGERFVYAYYEGVDTTAHEFGLAGAYERELTMVDRMVALLLEGLPSDTVLVVTADHGEVAMGTRPIQLDPAVLGACRLVSGEGRFRWLHTKGDPDELAEECRQRYSDVAVVLTRTEAIEQGLFGGSVPEAFADRLGDVAVIATAPVWFEDPLDQGSLKMRARHGGLSGAELLVPIAVGP